MRTMKIRELVNRMFWYSNLPYLLGGVTIVVAMLFVVMAALIVGLFL